MSARTELNIIQKPTEIFEIMAIIQNVLFSVDSSKNDFIFQMLRSRMLVRYIKFMLDMVKKNPDTTFNLKESIYRFCVGVSADIIEASWQSLTDSITYKLLKDERDGSSQWKPLTHHSF